MENDKLAARVQRGEGSAVTHYALVDGFDIDGGELAGLSLEKCFALGVEWSRVRESLAAASVNNDPPKTLHWYVHGENVARLTALGERYGYTVSARDGGDGWTSARFIPRGKADA